MEKNLLIQLLETGEKVSLYSPKFDGEEYTEFEKGTNLNGPLTITINEDEITEEPK